ncbi:MAG TPA: hypothetical protein VNH22_05125 [Blastocatellia bacterium]|jgi:hypothetical protein|nr:hypothetical protein [Blastocatellia bacterium]
MMKIRVVTLAAALLTGVALNIRVGNGSTGAQDKSSSHEKATLIDTNKISEKQRRHSKLYKDYSSGLPSIPDQIKSGAPKVCIQSHTMILYPTELDFRGVLTELACGADAAVIVKVENKSSQFTDSKDFLFTDYEVMPEEILKNNPNGPIASNSTLTITRPGGFAKYKGVPVEARDDAFPPLKVGDKYLLFLRYIPESGSYQAVSSIASFEIGDKKATKLTKGNFRVAGEVNDLDAFLTEVRAAINSPCQKK